MYRLGMIFIVLINSITYKKNDDVVTNLWRRKKKMFLTKSPLGVCKNQGWEMG
jgi:hypothetical protein